jgi:hypothetical protein
MSRGHQNRDNCENIKLIDSANRGCHLCILILQAFRETFFAGTDGKIVGFDEGKYQLQAAQDIPGWTLNLFLDCPISDVFQI